MMLGCAYLVIFVASLTAGYLGSLYEKMVPTQFWLMSAAIPATGALLIVLFGSALTRALARPTRFEPIGVPT